MAETEARTDLSWAMFVPAFLGAGLVVGLFDQFYTGRTGDLALDLLGAAAYGGGFLIALLLVWCIYWFGARIIFRSKRHTAPRRSLAIAAAAFGALLIIITVAK